MPINHLDLFSGIGGFAYAVDQVWPGATHTFCDNNVFCQKVLAKHWPESEIYGDIRAITDTESKRPREARKHISRPEEWATWFNRIDLLTGGFPCQPFSQAGKRKGTADDRHLWPEMFRVIQLAKPTWIIGENVPGIINIENGMVFEQVCADLENEGYEVQPFIIPACSINAPHRRDRVWIVANKSGEPERNTKRQGVSETKSEGFGGYRQTGCNEDWNKNWIEVATELCSLDDGLPVELGELKLTQAGHRREQLKAYGNAIVPQVAIEIMNAIKESYE